MAQTPPYPDFIKNLPQADLPIPGVSGSLLAGPHAQQVFFTIPAGSEIPLHSHGDQWGIVVEGEFDFNLGGTVHHFGPGDSYFVPAGVEHGAKFEVDCRIIEVFSDPNRWKAKA